MTDDGILNGRILLEHMQGLRISMDQGFAHVKARFERLEEKVDRGFKEMRLELDSARRHREMLQEDLEATIQTQFDQKKQLAVLSGSPLPEDY